jgi:hypothetical protein
MTTIPKTMKDAEALAADLGVILTPNERRKIAEIQTSERERLMSLQTGSAAPDLAARFNAFYPRLLQFILSIGETLLTFSQTVIVSLGVPTVLVLLLIVEHQRVVHGIALFETDYNLASFAAGALVLLNLVLEFQIHHIEHAAGYHEERERKWSLRIWANNALYTLGLGEQWQTQYLSPAARYKSLLRLVTFSILALALVGSMRSVIEGIQGTWYQGLISIFTQSTLLQLMTWLGGLLFALAAVLSAQGLSRYVAIRCVEIVAAMRLKADALADPLAADIDEAGALATLAIIREKQAMKEAKAQKAARAIETVEPVSIPMAAAQEAQAHEVVISPDFLAPVPQATNGNGKH